ncbi:MAG: DUF805 domain-containing protein [Deltaproteobacteria bacterium]|jgi:uncharacterized membrane protein YhaH (DUF805 family)|nr:DUF805 domain-containing protein [Deltaproteobacteria bacterium]
MESFQRDFLDVINKKYASIFGRARRREFWMFVVWHALASMALFALIALSYVISHTLAVLFLVLGALASLALIVPEVCLGVRRLHDIGLSGLFMLLHLVPGGSLALFIMFIIDTQPEDNRFGPNPKAQ